MKLTPAERRALHWLLRATDDGNIIAGVTPEQVVALKSIRLKLMEDISDRWHRIAGDDNGR